MRNQLLFILLLAPLGANTSCVQTECGDGTIERDGTCVPATNNDSKAECGPFTELQGDRCVPIYTPTMCDPTTSEPQVDPMTGITTCIGTGGGGCGSPLACPAPGGTKMTICGQLYDFENGQKFAGEATGARCDATSPTTTGPCALQVLAFDALVYGKNQTMGNITPTGSNDLYIDDCGRFRVANIETGTAGPFIGLGFTEAGKLPQRPVDQLTVTATTGFAIQRAPGKGVDKNEGFIVKPTTIMSWQNSGGPPLSGGIYVGIFRAHKLGSGNAFDPQPGVKFTKSNNLIPGQDYYFTPAATTNTTILTTSDVTGMTGAGLLTGTSVDDATAYSGTGGITSANCTWENHAAANLANIVFFQIYRKADIPLSQTPCAE